MAQSFYFYDLETSGVSPRRDRIMQFAGQRTDRDLKPVAKPDNIYVKLSGDVLPQPDAVLVHRITPQKTMAEGITEAEFAGFLTSQVSLPATVVVGFNNIRFDDEFIRHLLWRNFHDAYEWQWKNDCSRWDLLDVVRMTRALRPDGIKWPFGSDGQASNRLELLASVNKLTHDNVHDALSDVQASVALAQLLKAKQPKLFEYLLNLRNKNKVEAFVGKGGPFVYTSGRYASEFEKTTVVAAAARHPEGRGMLVYDLRTDPSNYLGLSAAQLAAHWQNRGEDAPRFPVKLLSYNKAPAVAPLSTLDQASLKRLKLNQDEIKKNQQLLTAAEGFGDKLIEALGIVYPSHQPQLVIDEQQVDGQLYDGFVNGRDRLRLALVRAADPNELSDLVGDFQDDRLKTLLPLYKARNFPQALTSEERIWWQNFRRKRLGIGEKGGELAEFNNRLEQLETQPQINKSQKALLKDLRAYANSITKE